MWKKSELGQLHLLWVSGKAGRKYNVLRIVEGPRPKKLKKEKISHDSKWHHWAILKDCMIFIDLFRWN